MGQILCYGDSNTWGYDAETGGRFSREERWTGLLQRIIGEDAVVAEEGLCGRTAVVDDPLGQGRNGREFLPVCLLTHAPIDLVILMLGTNDVKTRFCLSSAEISQGISLLIDDIEKSMTGRQGSSPAVLLISPVPVSGKTQFTEFLPDGPEKSQRLAGYYRQLARERGCAYLDASEAANIDPADGVHLSRSSQQGLAEAAADIWRTLSK